MSNTQEPAGCKRFETESGRFVVGQFDVQPGRVPEVSVGAILIRLFNTFQAAEPAARFGYVPVPNDAGGVRVQFQFSPPRGRDGLSFEWRDDCGRALREAHQAGAIGTYAYGLQELDAAAASFGGDLALQLFEKINSVASRAAFGLVSAYDVKSSPSHRAIAALQFNLTLLDGLAAESLKPQIPGLVAAWAERSVQEVRAAIPGAGEMSPASAEQATAALALATLNPSSLPWSDNLRELHRELEPLRPELAALAGGSPGLSFDWLGRRVLHPIFSRFYLDYSREILLTFVLTRLFKEYSDRWNRI